MKTLLNVLYAAAFLFLASCSDKMEVIPNYQEYMDKPEKMAALDTAGVKLDSKLADFNITDVNKKYSSLMNQAGWTNINEFKEAIKLGAGGSAAIDIDLYINEAGEPEKIQFKQNIDKEMQEKIAGYYSKLKFVPAENEGEKVKSKLGILLGTLDYKQNGKETLIWNYQEKGEALKIAKKNYVNDIEEGEYFQIAKEMPEPIGGIQSIMGKIVYPEIAKRAGIEGRVYVQAYVNKDGSVDGVDVLKGIGAGCDEAAMEVMLGAKFKPGRDENGNPVKTKVVVPFFFKLN